MKISNLKVKYFFRQKLREFIIKKHKENIKGSSLGG